MNDSESTDNRITKYVWRHIGKKSAREMAEELNVAPEDILRVKRDLVESVDDITISIHKMKLLASLQELADDAQERSRNVSDERNYSGMVNAASGAIDKLLKELNRTAKEDSNAVKSLNQLRIQELLRLMDTVVFKSVKVISSDHGIDEEELIKVFSDNLVEAAREIES